MSGWLLVMAGSALGGAARFGLSGVLMRRWSASFPWGTLLVNLAGCLAIGWLAGRGGRLSDEARLFLATGFCGGFTTFSAFALEAAGLPWGRAALYAAGSVAGGLAAFRLGLIAGR